MRVVRVVEYGIHTVFIGGAFVLLGGVAMADSTVPAGGTTTQPITQTQTNVDNTTGGTTTVTNDQTNTSNSSNVTNGKAGQGTGDETGVKSTATDNQTTAVTNSDNAGNGPDQGSKVTTPTAVLADGQGNDPNKVATSVSQQSGLPQATPVITQSIPQQPVQSSVPVVFVHSQALPIKPVITQTQSDSDLASAIASIPEPATAPMPPKPNSALGHLTGMVANVVPTLLFLAGTPVRLGLSTLALPVILFLLLGAYIFNYGLWLRRGGFATAARSDAPTSQGFFSPIATPHFLGYVFAPPRLHNPVFVVAEIKTGVKK